MEFFTVHPNRLSFFPVVLFVIFFACLRYLHRLVFLLTRLSSSLPFRVELSGQ